MRTYGNRLTTEIEIVIGQEVPVGKSYEVGGNYAPILTAASKVLLHHVYTSSSAIYFTYTGKSTRQSYRVADWSCPQRVPNPPQPRNAYIHHLLRTSTDIELIRSQQ